MNKDNGHLTAVQEALTVRANVENVLRNPRHWVGMGVKGAELCMTVRSACDDVIRRESDASQKRLVVA